MATTKKAQTQTGSRAIRAIFADAERAVADEAANTLPDPDPNEARDGIKAGQWPGFPSGNMPPQHPVQVIGRDTDGRVFALTATGHMRCVEKWDMPSLLDLHAPYVNSLKWAWPAFGKKKVQNPDNPEEQKEIMVVKRVERDLVVECFIAEAARKPDFDPNTQHRGRGGWVDSQNNFVWHSGGWLWQSGKTKLSRSRPAQHEGFLYTRQAGTIEPWSEPVTQEESPAYRALQDLRTWNWERPSLDPILLLGWLATSIMGGALRYRPIIFTTGGAGVGKSRLQELIAGMLEGVVMTTVNTTAAGIYQRAKHDSLPFLVDELESKPGSSRAESVIELARVAYSGGDISRGGQDHEATTFTARQSFMFSAINPPPMGAQDKSRMAVLNLGRLQLNAGQVKREMVIKPEVDGRMLLRQVMDGWQEFTDRTIPYYAGVLNEFGLSARAIDTFGTLLAAAELLVGPAVLEEMGLPVTDPSHLGNMIASATSIERTENLDNWHACIDHLMQSAIDAWREGVKPTIGGVCERVRTDHQFELSHARERLALANLGILGRGKAGPNTGPCLAVPADGPTLQRIFGDTMWHKSVWYQALKQAPTDVVLRGLGNTQKVKINGSAKHCLLIDLQRFDEYAAKVE
jgi:hypothetical protein